MDKKLSWEIDHSKPEKYFRVERIVYKIGLDFAFLFFVIINKIPLEDALLLVPAYIFLIFIVDKFILNDQKNKKDTYVLDKRSITISLFPRTLFGKRTNKQYQWSDFQSFSVDKLSGCKKGIKNRFCNFLVSFKNKNDYIDITCNKENYKEVYDFLRSRLTEEAPM